MRFWIKLCCAAAAAITLATRSACQTPGNPGCKNNFCDKVHGSCVDVLGSISYACDCSKGYELQENDTRSCADIDECKQGYCSHGCTNLPGGYYCSCPAGLVLDSDNRTCIDFNECADVSSCAPNEICVNSVGGFACLLGNLPLNASDKAVQKSATVIIPSGLQKLFTDEYFIVMLAVYSLTTVLSLLVAFLLLQRSRARLKVEAARKRRFYESRQNTLSTLQSY